MKILFLLLCLFFVNQRVHSQGYFRFSADFSIKAKDAAGKGTLTMGRVYYDKNIRKIVYQTKFPEIETWVTADTCMFKFANGKLVQKAIIPSVVEMSIYHLALNGQLPDFGLKKSFFKVEKVEKENEMVITTWLPPSNFANKIGKILVSNKEKKLFGIVFLDVKGAVAAKQFFNNYQNYKGLFFPTEIVNIKVLNGKELYEVTTYKNIKVNDYVDDNLYNYAIPR